ncbi:MAG: hypothetical protein N0E37_03625, partial [Candidatus Thiodiazotropha taylori]|nr:hypothetical protein [Candidatus Thiodiazotropha taylori]MCW4243515.1 hypothetical protein [Candidatus Thiodiazotropha taylori]
WWASGISSATARIAEIETTTLRISCIIQPLRTSAQAPPKTIGWNQAIALTAQTAIHHLLEPINARVPHCSLQNSSRIQIRREVSTDSWCCHLSQSQGIDL